MRPAVSRASRWAGTLAGDVMSATVPCATVKPVTGLGALTLFGDAASPR